MHVEFQLRKKQPKKELSLGLEGWKEQTQSVFNDIITQTSLEQASKEVAMKRPVSSTPRSVVSHVVKNIQDDFWWSHDLESRLQ